MAKTKLSGYFLCALLLLFGNAWCASSNELITYAFYEIMKMNSVLTAQIKTDAADLENSHAIKNQFELDLKSSPPGSYTYHEEAVYNYIKDQSILLTLRSQLVEAFFSKTGCQLNIIEAKFPGMLIEPEPAFEISSVQTIYIYKDEGVSDFSASICEEAIKALDQYTYPTQRINAKQTICLNWKQNAKAYIMPGGADLSFCEKLNGTGNKQIREYVEVGGNYIGFCAGAYYGSSFVEFNKGNTDGNEVIAARELSFFPGTAVGPLLAPFTPTSKKGVRIANIKWIADNSLNGENYNIYYNGGCSFKDADQFLNVHVLATYANEGFEGLAAIVKCQVGQGKALLSGVHPECSKENIELEMKNRSLEDQHHWKNEIIPALSNGSHKEVFKALIEQL